MLTLAIVLLALSFQSIGYSQLRVSPPKIKDESTRYVVWIVHEKGSGSGVLISKDNRLVVTNAHVTGDYKEVEVFFGVRDSSGNIVRAQPFYRNQDHQNTLQRLGYVTRGRVIAKHQHPGNEPDLAMIELDGLPETVSPPKLLTSIDYSKMQDEPVHILGHPAERDLWHWKAGFFKEKKGSDLHIFADAYYGNSGGPVLNKDGNLIGITRAIIEDAGITFAIPTSAIIDLYQTLEPVKIFSIYNNTEIPMSYEIKWKKDEDWKEEKESLESKKERIYSLPSKGISDEYPKIRFEDSQDNKESSKNIMELEAKSRFFGKGIKDVEDFNNHIEINDSLRYQFMSDPEIKKISLVKMKLVQIFIIQNNTKSAIFYQYKWHEDEEWKEGYIMSGKSFKHGATTENVSQGYPKIRFDEIPGGRNYPEKNRSLFTQTGYFDENTETLNNVKQMGWSPPLYYQFKNNVETNRIFLDEMRLFQEFSIQNTTDAFIHFHYRWDENDKWKPGYVSPNETSLFPNKTIDYLQLSDNVPSNYATIKYSENVSEIADRKISSAYVSSTDDNKSSEKINTLEIKAEYVGKNLVAEPSRFHFKYNSITKKLTLYKGLPTNSKKSTGRSFPFLRVVFILIVFIGVFGVVVLIIEILFPKKHIFSLQNNTEATMNYHVKWTKKGDWKPISLEPGQTANHWWPPGQTANPSWTGFFKKKPQIRFVQIVNDKDLIINNEWRIANDKKNTEDEVPKTGIETQVELKTKARRFRQNSSTKISREDTRKYHFGYDSETNEIVLMIQRRSD